MTFEYKCKLHWKFNNVLDKLGFKSKKNYEDLNENKTYNVYFWKALTEPESIKHIQLLKYEFKVQR